MKKHRPSVPEMVTAISEKTGLSDLLIGEKVGTSQPNIHRLRHGNMKSTSFEIGIEIYEWYKSLLAIQSSQMFEHDRLVKHLKTGDKYRIIAVPNEETLLEYCAETYYEYQDENSGKKWVRCKSEMEDGRFVAI
jgi:hypothetical protein